MPPASRRREHRVLSGVKWRFLSESITTPSHSASFPDWTNEARRRIAYLERALTSTNQLESQYQAFVAEAARSAPEAGGGISFDWDSTNALLSPASVHDAVAAQVNSSDIIPSDPIESATSHGLRNAASQAAASDGSPSMHSKEDAEVSRVYHKTDKGGNMEEEPRNAPSPVIIWRHAAPVKIATNLPPDLMPPEQANAHATSIRRHAVNENNNTPVHGGARAIASTAVANEIKERRAAVAKRTQYGAWYLPTEQWSARTQVLADETGRGQSKPVRSLGGGSATGGTTDGDEQAGEQDLSDTIPKLYSSRMYKEYLKSQRHTRMPHYLLHVEDSPKHSNSLSSRRGNIPLIESPTDAGSDGM
ncbi:MAG: hypothetical protein SGPRY_014553 [Prymnesium sp.]